jgi:hypothetical protein
VKYHHNKLNRDKLLTIYIYAFNTMAVTHRKSERRHVLTMGRQGRHESQPNDIQQGDAQNDDTQLKETLLNDTQFNYTQLNYTHHK